MGLPKNSVAKGKKYPNTLLVYELKPHSCNEVEDLFIDLTIKKLKEYRLLDPSKVAFISFSYHICKRLAEILPDFRRRSGVPEQLERIRRKEYYYFDRGEISIFAAPIFCNGIFTASFGFSTDSEKCTGDGFEQVLVSIRNAAAEVSRSLSVSDTIG